MMDLIFALLQLVAVGWPVWLALALYVWWQYRRFKQSKYYDATGNGFLKTYFDTGLYGEYLIYQVLEKCPGHKHLLANVYLPKGDGGTTEVDVIMVHEAGIFVFESKNYSGWIYGDEKNQMWTQVLNKRTKHKMFNPIWQNRGHISAVKKALEAAEIDDSLIRSYIVFGEGCNLQQVKVSSLDVRVLKRGELKKQLSRDLHQAQSMGALAPNTVDRAYELLSHYARADQAVKDAHIAHIKQKHGGRSS
ncbi:MAG: NERD domain-containing protein [Firmicutes bacterium]|nr:NERD domain-containing protein [Dethiobacter sp.]MBS3888242.1 NERD domain-containing protein [Bacillota bacterium]